MTSIMVRIVFALALVSLPLLLVSTTRRADPKTARQALMADGYVDIVVADRPDFASVFAGCDKHYFMITPFEATLAGHRARGVVCSGGGIRQGPQVRRSD